MSFVDAWWPIGMALLAAVAFARSGTRGPHALALTLLTLVWALRLGLHLFIRWRRQGADPRYHDMLEDAETRRGWSFSKASLLLVFALQAPLQLVAALPVELGQEGAPGPLGLLGWTGALLAALGVLLEAIADAQLARFKSDPLNKGQVMDRGLWRYSRHPNYFGEACVWWGLYLLAAETPLGIWSLPGPLLITVLLTRVSGAPTVEGRMKERGPAYVDYVRRTSGFIPWIPKSAPPPAP